MPITIKQIAKIAGVSRGTVDRALNHRAGVNKDVAERIREIAESLGYRPNPIAKALAFSGNVHQIGVILNNIGNPFFDEVIRGIHEAEKEIAKYGFQLKMIHVEGYKEEDQLEAIAKLKSAGIHALALTPVSSPAVRTKLNELSTQNIPVVCINLDVEGVDYLAYVGCDYTKSGEVLGQMVGFITSGNAQLGVVACSSNLDCHRMRAEGCRTVLMNEFPNSRILHMIEAEDNEQIAYEKTRQMLIQYPEINALCINAGGTRGGLQAVASLSLEHKLKICTFDLTPVVIDSIQKEIVQATICQQPFRQGYQSVKILFDYLSQGILPPSDHIYTELEVKIKHNL